MPIEHISRRLFVERVGLLAGASLLPASEAIPSPEYLLLCEHNPRAGMVNLSVLPDCLYCHSPREVLSMNINFKATYDPDSKDGVNRSTNQGNLWQYGKGLQEAIKRGQDVFLVLDFPWHLDKKPIEIKDWEGYVRSLALDYQGATFIMDNELDAPEKVFWRENPLLFASYYLSAATIIREAAPDSKIFFPAESYKGDGKITRLMLEAISMQSSEGSKLPGQSFIDGLAVHVYVRAGLVRERIRQFKAAYPGFTDKLPLCISELGKTEGVILSPEEHTSALVQGMSTALSCVSQEVLSAIWNAGFVIKKADPAEHSLTQVDAKGNLSKTPALDAFWQVCRLLYHSVAYEERDGITVVSGLSSNGDKTEIVWRNSQGRGSRYYKGEELQPSINPALEGKPRIFFESFSQRRRNFFPWGM